MDRALIPEINTLLKKKEETSEMGMTPRIAKLNDYIEASLAYLDEEIRKQSSDQPKKPWGVLNEIFLRALDTIDSAKGENNPELIRHTSATSRCVSGHNGTTLFQ